MQVLAPSSRRLTRSAGPLRAGESSSPEVFASIRTQLILRHCKWDPQVEDVSTLAAVPLLMGRLEWERLRADAEALAAEVIESERELLDRPDLHATVAI